MTERLWFQQAVEGCFVKGLGNDLTPALRAELASLGIDVEHLLPGYPVELVSQGLRVAAKHLPHPDGEGVALRELGRRFMLGYQQTFIGRAMVTMMGVLGVHRVLPRMKRNISTGGNFMETRFTLLEPGRGLLWLSDVGGVPDFWEGVLLQGAVFSNAPTTTVTYATDLNGPGCTYEIQFPA